MKNEKTAVVIGAGIGGIATAVFLAKNGYKVDIYEKNSAAGGRCGQLIRDGYRFDLGASMLMMPGIYKQVFQSLEIPLFDDPDIRPADDLYSIYFDNNEKLTFTKDENRMREQLERIEPGSFAKSQQYVTKGYEIFGIGINQLIGRNFDSFFEFATLKNTALLIKLKTYINNYSYAKKFFRHPRLRMAYTFQNIYVGQDPFHSPALFSMIPAAELTEGSYFPKGGMFTIVRKLESAAIEQGVNFHFNSPVSKINISGRKAESIVLDNSREVRAEVIVANSDLPYVYRRLLPGWLKSAWLDKLNYSCSAISFHWGLEKVYPQLGQHRVFLSDRFQAGLKSIFTDKSVNNAPN